MKNLEKTWLFLLPFSRLRPYKEQGYRSSQWLEIKSENTSVSNRIVFEEKRARYFVLQ